MNFSPLWVYFSVGNIILFTCPVHLSIAKSVHSTGNNCLAKVRWTRPDKELDIDCVCLVQQLMLKRMWLLCGTITNLVQSIYSLWQTPVVRIVQCGGGHNLMRNVISKVRNITQISWDIFSSAKQLHFNSWHWYHTHKLCMVFRLVWKLLCETFCPGNFRLHTLSNI